VEEAAQRMEEERQAMDSLWQEEREKAIKKRLDELANEASLANLDPSE
jgi:hypothetical protein